MVFKLEQNKDAVSFPFLYYMNST